jgi:hypothetical protein
MVDYQKMTAVLVDAVKEQETEIDRVRDEKLTLEGRVDELESRLVAMERQRGGSSTLSTASGGGFGGVRDVLLCALVLGVVGAGSLGVRRYRSLATGMGGVR